MTGPFIHVRVRRGRETWVNVSHIATVEVEPDAAGGEAAAIRLVDRSHVSVEGTASDLVSRIEEAIARSRPSRTP